MLPNNPVTILLFIIGPFSLGLLGLATCTAVSSPPAATPPDSPTPAQEAIPSPPPSLSALPPTAGPVLPPSSPLPKPSVYIVQFKQDLNSQQQTEFIAAMEQRLQRRVEVLYRYETVYNGLAVFLTPQEALQVAEMDAVRQIQPDYPRSLQDQGGRE